MIQNISGATRFFLYERGIEVTSKEWNREDQSTIINVQTNLNIHR